MAESRVLGCVLAGGQSSRFGSDKALAQLDGRSLLARAVDQLSPWCGQVVVVGREAAPAPTLPDWPSAGMGPLAGIAAALLHARREGFSAVLTCGVDSPGLPGDLPALLAPAPAFVAAQPVVGLWPVDAFDALAAILRSDGSRSMRRFAESIGARPVQLGVEPANINTQADLVEAGKRRER